MLFNSYVFLLGFLPATIVGYAVAGRHSKMSGVAWLALASFVFYGWWDWRYVPLLIGSICFNFVLGSNVARRAGSLTGKRLLVLAIAANLALLAYFKYTDFFITTVNAVAGSDLPLLRVVLPLGISFYTFTQIAFLVDAYRGEAREYKFINYALFVTYFPHLIAGPILHHKEMMPQFARGDRVQLRASNFAAALSIFAIGLAKKVLVADNLAPYANAAFADASTLSFFTAWAGVLAYAFQLYFDFSGYSDMAIGLSRLFGIKLPLNFNSPYKATNISDFWRRWHMTLSRFLRDYLYVPLGGNRRGPVRRYRNLIITMGLGGLWHGAGWGFLLWGLLHGAYLCLHHAWQGLRAKLGMTKPAGVAGRAFAVAVTFLAVVFGWVLFRAGNIHDAFVIMAAMVGQHGVALPDAIGSRLGEMRAVMERFGITFYLGGGTQAVLSWLWVASAAVLAFAFPNTQQIMRMTRPALQRVEANRRGWNRVLVWQPRPAWAVTLALLWGFALLSMSNPTEFLYFQF